MNENNKIEITLETGDSDSVHVENKVLSDIADLNYGAIERDALIGIVKDDSENGYKFQIIDNVKSPEYLKTIPGYNKILQILEQTKHLEDVLPDGVSISDYENVGIKCIKYLFETLLDNKKRVYICYDPEQDKIILTRDKHDNYVYLDISDNFIFNMPFSEVSSSTNIIFKIYNEDNKEKTHPVNEYYYLLEECFDRGFSKTRLNVTNPAVIRNAKSFAILSIRNIKGETDRFLINKIAETVESGKLTLFTIQYMLQEIAYDLTIENTPDHPQLYLTNDHAGNLVWKDLNGITLHSDGVKIRKKNVFFEEKDDYGNIDYKLYLGFDFDEEELSIEFNNILNYDENAVLLIADNQFITKYDSEFKDNKLNITIPPATFNPPEDGCLTFTLIILTTSELEKTEFAKEYITRKEALHF